MEFVSGGSGVFLVAENHAAFPGRQGHFRKGESLGVRGGFGQGVARQIHAGSGGVGHLHPVHGLARLGVISRIVGGHHFVDANRVRAIDFGYGGCFPVLVLFCGKGKAVGVEGLIYKRQHDGHCADQGDNGQIVMTTRLLLLRRFSARGLCGHGPTSLTT